MDDRWAACLDGETLRCWRSWTGTCIYESQLTRAEDCTGVAPVVDVLDDVDTYRRAATDDGGLERSEGVLSQVQRLRICLQNVNGSWPDCGQMMVGFPGGAAFSLSATSRCRAFFSLFALRYLFRCSSASALALLSSRHFFNLSAR